MNRVDRIFSNSSAPNAFARAYLNYVCDVLVAIDENSVAGFIETLLKARETGARIFFIGNGGSAATASHFANDIAVGSRSYDKPFRAIALTDNQAILTAIANDDGYEHVFVQQLQIQMSPGDVVVAISASGNSPNVVSAVEYARAHGARTVALTGFDGGKLGALADQQVHIPTNMGEYGPAEDGHMVIDHLVGAYLARCVREA